MIENRIVGIVGPAGSGKTYHAARMFGSETRAVLYQPVRVNEESDIYATHIANGDIRGVIRELRQEKYRIIYKVPDSDCQMRGAKIVYSSFVPLLEACYQEGNVTLYIDEAHDILAHKQIEHDPEALRIIHLSRNNRLSIVWIGWGLEAHRDILRITREYHFYRIWHQGDLDKIAWRCGELTMNRVANLTRLHKEDSKIIPGEMLIWSEEDAQGEDQLELPGLQRHL